MLSRLTAGDCHQLAAMRPHARAEECSGPRLDGGRRGGGRGLGRTLLVQVVVPLALGLPQRHDVPAPRRPARAVSLGLVASAPVAPGPSNPPDASALVLTWPHCAPL